MSPNRTVLQWSPSEWPRHVHRWSIGTEPGTASNKSSGFCHLAIFRVQLSIYTIVFDCPQQIFLLNLPSLCSKSMLTFGTHSVVPQRCPQKAFPGVRCKTPSSCVFCCLTISLGACISPVRRNSDLFFSVHFPHVIHDLYLYLLSHTFALSEKSQINCKEAASSLPYIAQDGCADCRCSGCKHLVVEWHHPLCVICIYTYIYIYVCMCIYVRVCAPHFHHRSSYHSLCRFKQTGEGVSGECRLHFLLTHHRTCFSQDLSNTQN